MKAINFLKLFFKTFAITLSDCVLFLLFFIGWLTCISLIIGLTLVLPIYIFYSFGFLFGILYILFFITLISTLESMEKAL